MESLASLAEIARILVVDDDETNLRLMTRVLAKDGYTKVRTSAEPDSIEDVVDDFGPDLILLDLHMPQVSGYDVLRRLGPRINGPGLIAVLVLTGDGSPNAKLTALSLGARDFLSKPFDATEALLRIRNLLETRFLHRELAEQNAKLEVRVKQRTSALERSQIEILERLARTAEIRDDETGRHTYRVGEMSATLAAALGLPSKEVDLIRRAAPLHDVGKIGIPDSILLKPGSLTPEETALMRTHTVIGAQILSGGSSDLIMVAERIALNHHERWDGGGYPNGISGAAIPIEARIVAVADCVDALANNRPYRRAQPMEDVIDEVTRCSGTQFDPAVVDAMVAKARGVVCQ